jgi:hypothetical protein
LPTQKKIYILESLIKKTGKIMIVKTLKRAAVITAILSATTVANANDLCFKNFQIGGDVIGTTLDWDSARGQKILPKNPIAFSLFTGAEFYTHNQFGLGLELGVEYMQKTRNSTLYTNQMINNGNSIDAPIVSIAYKSRLRSVTPYLGLTANYKISNNFKLIGMIGTGVSFARVKQTTVTVLENESGTITAEPLLTGTLNFKRTAVIPMARIGVQYDFNEHFGVRANVGYRYLNTLRSKQPSFTGTGTIYAMQAKRHCFTFAPGVVFTF